VVRCGLRHLLLREGSVRVVSGLRCERRLRRGRAPLQRRKPEEEKNG
jgi:hypothetical protein